MRKPAGRDNVRPKKSERPQQPVVYPQVAAPTTAVRDSSVEHWLGEFELAAGDAASESSWLKRTRREAMDRLAQIGFPTTKNEDWHFTSVAPITAHEWRVGRAIQPIRLTASDIKPFLFEDQDWQTLVFVNGVFAPDLSRGLGEAQSRAGDSSGVIVSALAERLRADDFTTGSPCSIADFRAAAFTALNTAFFRDGAFIRVPRGATAGPIHLLFVSAPDRDENSSHPRNLIVVEENASATIVESYVGIGERAYLTNAVTEIALRDGARLVHVKIQRESTQAFHVGTSETVQGRDCVYHSFSYAIGAELSRTNVYTLLDGEGSTAILNGLYMVDGTQHVDHQTRIEHAKPNCTSHEIYKGVLDGRSHGVFNGKVFVRPEAQKTDGKQSNNNLLLSPHAQIDTKPQLEIFADDVKCTHGATVGRLDEMAMFYLRSRGIELGRARTLLTYAFAAEVLEEIEIEPVRLALEQAVLARVSGEAS